MRCTDVVCNVLTAPAALEVRKTAERAEKTRQNLPPHHLHIYMQGAEKGAGGYFVGAENEEAYSWL